MKKFVLATSAAVALLVGTASPAEAVFRMRIEDLGAGVGTVLTDNGAGDGSTFTDVILFSGTVGAFTISIQVGLATPGVPIGGFFDAILLNDVSVTSTGGTLRVILEKDGFVNAPNGPILLKTSVGGVNSAPAGSTVSFFSWANAGNLIPSLGADQPVGTIGAVLNLPPAGSTGVIPSGSPFGPGAFSATTSVAFTKTGPHSLFSSAIVSIVGGGSVSFDQSTGTNPAPAGLLLLAAGLPCLGLAYLRRKKAVKALIPA